MKNSIAKSILRNVSFIITLTFMAFTSLLIIKSYSDSKEERRSYVEFILNSTSRSILAPLSRGNLYEVEDILQNANYQPFVRAILVKHEGEIISSYQAQNNVKINHLLLLSKDVSNHDLIIYWSLEGLARNEFIKALILVSLLILFLFTLTFFLKKNINNAFYNLTKNISNQADSNTLNKFNLEQSPIEILPYLEKINELLDKVTIYQTEKARLEIAKQVAHDIRSPLAALNMVQKETDSLPEVTRLMLRSSVSRIQDIANNLLNTKENKNFTSTTKDATYLLAPIIEEVLSEKRTAFRGISDLYIDLNAENSYGIFVKVDQSQLKRIISNLINNSVEALDNNSGQINISFKQDNNYVNVIISDTGKGIAPDIIPKLTAKGASYGKEKATESGSGLGLYHAKNFLESWGGDIQITSQLGIGTNITLSIPLQSKPNWFVPKLKLNNIKKVVVIDDDSSIHKVWEARFKDFLNDNFELLHFTNPHNFKNWVSHNTHTECLFLCDYEFIGHKTNGLDLIFDTQISAHAILITSRYEDQNIRERCDELGIKLIPKMMAEMVPIEIKATNDRIHLIHVDDDPLIRLSWQHSAQKHGKKILSYAGPEDLYKDLKNISKTTPLYIDSSLGENVMKGEELAKILYDLGHKNIYLSTGYSADNFSEMYWIKGVIGKRSPMDS